MKYENVVIGLDGGATRTRGVLFDYKQHLVLNIDEAGPANPYGTQPPDFDVASRNVIGLVEHLVDSADSSHPTALCLASAGLGRPDDVEKMAAILLRHPTFQQTKLLLTTDGNCALAAGSMMEPGIAAIASTGSIVLYLDDKGHFGRLGGYGWRLADQGSAYSIAVKALQVVMMAHDGMLETTMVQPILEALHFKSPNELVAWSLGADKPTIANLAPIVFAAAEAGDIQAKNVILDAVEELANLIIVAAERTGGREVFASGGNFDHQPLFTRYMADLLDPSSIRLVKPELKPVAGAVLLALRKIGEKITPQTIRMLKAV